MSEAIYTLKFSDGSQMTGLKLNGNNFVSVVEVSAADFRGKLSGVEITGTGEGVDGSICGVHEHMELVQVVHYTRGVHGVADGWYFVLMDIPAEEYEALKNRSDIDYIAMMIGVTL